VFLGSCNSMNIRMLLNAGSCIVASSGKVKGCRNVNPLEQVLAGTPSHFYHGQVQNLSVRVSQPVPAPVD
jgi:hypothetical protein